MTMMTLNNEKHIIKLTLSNMIDTKAKETETEYKPVMPEITCNSIEIASRIQKEINSVVHNLCKELLKED